MWGYWPQHPLRGCITRWRSYSATPNSFSSLIFAPRPLRRRTLGGQNRRELRHFSAGIRLTYGDVKPDIPSPLKGKRVGLGELGIKQKWEAWGLGSGGIRGLDFPSFV